MAEKFTNLFIGLGAALAGPAIILNTFFYTVDAGERAIVFDRTGGLREKVYGEGMHFYLPYVQSPVKFDIRLQPLYIKSKTGTRDMQTVDIALRILHRPISEFLPSIYTNIGKNYKDTILPSIGNEVLKAIVAQYDVDQLLKLREKISAEIRESLTIRARDFNLALDDVALVHISFMKEYTQAIENKQVAQQMAERQKFVVLKSEEEKKAEIIRAEGEAESARLINEAVKSHGGGSFFH